MYLKKNEGKKSETMLSNFGDVYASFKIWINRIVSCWQTNL